jgi:hypothetical protein
MTVVENEDFTCHVCGQRYACDVVVSTNNFGGAPAWLPPPSCPVCGTQGRHRIRFTPGGLLDLLFEIAENEGIPESAVETLLRWSTSEDDIESWRIGFARQKWQETIRGNLKFVHATITQMTANIRSPEPFGDFNNLQHDAAGLREPNEATRRFAAIKQPEFESWPQMNRELRAMMDADPQIQTDAEEVIARKWGRHAASYQRLAEELEKDLPAKVQFFFDQVQLEFSRRVREARARLAAEGKLLG